MDLKFFGRVLCCIGIVMLLSGHALAHNVTVFAWVDGDTAFGESKFSGGRRPKGAEVIVWDTEGNELLRTQTDDNGEFSFKIPKKTGMRIELIAGMGHKGEWKIPLEELGELGELGEDTAGSGADETAQTPAVEPSQETITPEAVAAAPGLTEAQLEAIVGRVVDKSLNTKFKPVMKILADMEETGPSVNDVMGGIGYIFGLMGVAAYFKSRRKKG